MTLREVSYANTPRPVTARSSSTVLLPDRQSTPRAALGRHPNLTLVDWAAVGSQLGLTTTRSPQHARGAAVLRLIRQSVTSSPRACRPAGTRGGARRCRGWSSVRQPHHRRPADGRFLARPRATAPAPRCRCTTTCAPRRWPTRPSCRCGDGRCACATGGHKPGRRHGGRFSGRRRFVPLARRVGRYSSGGRAVAAGGELRLTCRVDTPAGVAAADALVSRSASPQSAPTGPDGACAACGATSTTSNVNYLDASRPEPGDRGAERRRGRVRHHPHRHTRARRRVRVFTDDAGCATCRCVHSTRAPQVGRGRPLGDPHRDRRSAAGAHRAAQPGGEPTDLPPVTGAVVNRPRRRPPPAT